jgi:hypothetical protein
VPRTGDRSKRSRSGSATRKALREASQQAEEQIKAALGEQRYAEYQRSQDYNFRNLVQVRSKAGWDKDTAIKAYEAQKLAQQQAATVQRDTQLTPELRKQMLQALQQEFEKTMSWDARAIRAFRIINAPAVIESLRELNQRATSVW